MQGAEYYCSQVCGARCCTVAIPGKTITCPALSENRTCSIYKERFEDGIPFSFNFVEHIGPYKQKHNFNCTSVIELIEKKRLAKHIEDQCCFAHPEILEMAAPNGVRTWMRNAWRANDSALIDKIPAPQQKHLRRIEGEPGAKVKAELEELIEEDNAE